MWICKSSGQDSSKDVRPAQWDHANRPQALHGSCAGHALARLAQLFHYFEAVKGLSISCLNQRLALLIGLEPSV